MIGKLGQGSKEMEAPLIAVEREEDQGPRRRTLGAMLISVRGTTYALEG